MFNIHETLTNAYIIISNPRIADYFLILIGVIVAGLVKFLVSPARPKKLTVTERISKALPHLEAGDFLSGNEIEFFYRLQRALPNMHIFTQVSFSALMRVKAGRFGKEFYAVFDQYCKLRADYVVCAPQTLEVIAVIELDDASHKDKKEKDEQRDRMLREVGYKVIRFDSKNRPTVAQIAASILP